MITAMTVLLTLLALLSATLLLAAYVRRVIRDDGYTHRSQEPPRSHYPDPFDPSSGPMRLA